MVLQGNLKSKYIWKDKDINVGSGGYLGPPVGRGGPPAIPHGSVVLKPPSIMPDGLTGFIMVLLYTMLWEKKQWEIFLRQNLIWLIFNCNIVLLGGGASYGYVDGKETKTTKH